MRVALLGLVLIGCGRVAFDPLGDAGTAATDATDAAGPDALLDPSLAAWYPLDDEFFPDLFARDATGHGHTAMCGTCPSRMAGRNGGFAAHFDGNSDHLVIADHEALTFGDDYTIALWINPQGPPTGLDGIIDRQFGVGSDNTYAIHMRLDAGGGRFEFFGWPDAPFPSVRRPVSGTWMHLALIYDGMKHLYIDGTLDIDIPQDPTSSDLLHSVVIGADEDNDVIGNYYLGLIADVRFYSRALSPAEIAVLAQ